MLPYKSYMKDKATIILLLFNIALHMVGIYGVSLVLMVHSFM